LGSARRRLAGRTVDDDRRVQPLSDQRLGTASTRHDEAQPLFERAFREYGLPATIRSDNGAPFASTGVSGLTALSAWWIKLGIRHERIDPGHPQQNGRHERFHRTLLEAMTPPEPDLAAQQRRFARDYNEERPHQALGQRTPASVYEPSARPMPERIAEPDYPPEAAARQGALERRNQMAGDLIAISTALAGEAVAVEETEDGQWLVRFYDTAIGLIDTHKKKLRRLAVPADRDGEAQDEDKP